MENWNWQLFSAMAGGFAPQVHWLTWAKWWAVYGSWLAVALLLIAGWRQARERLYLLGALLACLLAAGLGHRLALALGHPRPFMLGLSPAYIAHAARGSLPSVHATALFTLALCLLWRRPLRASGALVLLVAALVGWARVYCGIHFPFDILGGLLLAACGAAAYAGIWRRFGKRWLPLAQPVAVPGLAPHG